ncbi:MAG: DeoR family transcriptional regulator [Anaerolineae bacterium]
MGKNGRLVGIILMGLGLIIFLGGSAASLMSTATTEGGSLGGAVLGVIISVFVAVLPLATGVYLLTQSRSEAVAQADMTRQRQILDTVKARGQVDIRDLVFELKTSTDQIRSDIYRLVGLGLFTGYINWDKGMLYSCEASQLTGNKCPNCGGEQQFVGKGVIACKYCGAEIFL